MCQFNAHNFVHKGPRTRIMQKEASHSYKILNKIKITSHHEAHIIITTVKFITHYTQSQSKEAQP